MLQHFTPEEIASLKAEEARQAELHRGYAVLDNDGERMREAMQRMVALEANGETETDSYAECLYETGRIQEAIDLVSDEEKKAHWTKRLEAILRDDTETCGHRQDQVIRKFPSARHGRMATVTRCLQCRFEQVK